MASFSFIECCRLLSVDPKTLRQWLTQAELSLHSHPTDARIKCLTGEQVHLLADLHHRVVPGMLEGLARGAPTVRTDEAQGRMELSEAEVRARLAHLESQVVTLHTHLTDLALQLLKQQPLHPDQQVQVLQVQQAASSGYAFPAQAESAPSQPSQSLLLCHPTAHRQPLIPLIEYGASGRYVLLSPEEGELPIVPDSGEWFAWLASLSSFRFVGQSGRFSARRGYNRRPNRCWYAQRGIHQKNYSKYLGVSEHITTDRLEQVAAQFQAHLQ